MLLAVLAGLFAMHGLAGHGSQDMAAMSGMGAAAGMTASDSMAPDAASLEVSGSPVALAPQAVPEGDRLPVDIASHGPASPVDAARSVVHELGGVDLMTMAMAMCLAVLGAGLLLLALLLSTRRRVAWRLPRLVRSRSVLGAGRPPKAPSLTLLSVCRC